MRPCFERLTPSFSLIVITAVFFIYYKTWEDDAPWNPMSRLCPGKTTGNRSHCYKNKFKDIALIIIYNNPLYDTVPILKEFYQPVFPNIFVCGAPKPNVENITVVDIRRGILGYECLGDVIRKRLSFRGYFYINDDVILNYWNLRDFDADRIWHSNNQFGGARLDEKGPTAWYWWISPYGFNNTRKALARIKTLAQRFKVYTRFYQQFLKNGQGVPIAQSGRSDILYVPQRYAMGFQELSRIFYREQVFLEIAIPTIIRFLSDEREMRTLDGHYIPGDVRKKDPRVIDARIFWITYLSRATIAFIHPFKLHHYKDNNRAANLLIFEHLLVEKTKRLTSC